MKTALNFEQDDIKKLDEVLKYLATIQRPNSFREFYEMKKELAERGLHYDEFELWIIMDKLCKDKYVSTEAKYVNYVEPNKQGGFEETQRLNHRFYITYDGRLFIKFGGYYQQEKDIITKRNLRKWEKGLLVFGAVAAGLYSLYQLYHAIFPTYCCHH